MQKPGENDVGRRLAMAGRKSPWGDDGGAAETDPPPAPNEGDAEGAVKDKEPARPLNPWLPTPGSEPERRSPSIDDIFRQQARLRGGKGGGLPTRNWLPFVLAGIAAVWIGGTSVHVLSSGEQGLVTTLGRYDRTVGPGLTLTLPWPVQAVKSRNTATIEEAVLPAKDGENLMLTRDRQLADVSAKLRWRVTDLHAFAYNSGDTPALIAQLADSEVHAAVAEQRFDDLVEGQRRGELQQLIATRSQAALDALKLGVRVEGAEIIRAFPPQKLSQAFRKVAEAREAARNTVAQASAEAQKTIGEANAEADRFESVYVQYQAAPEITRKRRYYEAMERVLVNNNKVVVGGSGVTVNVTPPDAAPAADPSPAATGAP